MMNRIDLTGIDLSCFGARNMVKINGAEIPGVKAYKITQDSAGHVDITLVISAEVKVAESSIRLQQPSNDCGSNGISDP
mgnify:CR=1 FL=1